MAALTKPRRCDRRQRKFIERNWGLEPLTDRSRDNLPNPVAQRDNPYIPANMPAIGDLFDMFEFGQNMDRDRDL